MGITWKKALAGITAIVMALLVIPSTACGAFAESGQAVWDGSADYSWYDPDAKEYRISTPEELAGFANIVNGQAGDIEQSTFSGKTLMLENDIDLGISDPKSAPEWTPIGYNVKKPTTSDTDFRGTFDGQGHRISLPVTGKTIVYTTGLFGYVYHAQIQNLTVDLAYSDSEGMSTESHGGVATHATGCTFSNITVDGTVVVGYNFGGVVYESAGCIFKGCTNNADIHVLNYPAGGICGITSQTTASSTFTRCVNNGRILSGRQADALGYTNNAGGILGYSGTYGSYSDKIDQCENNGDILKGEAKAAISGQGGIVGGCYQGGVVCALSITNCYNTGNIEAGTGSYGSGGILGINDSTKVYIKNCYNAGTITNPKYAGGIAGCMPSDKVSAAMTVNNWYLFRSADSGVGTITDITGIYERFASSSKNNYTELIDALGDCYTSDYHQGKTMAHGGFPILTWQKKDDTYAAIFTIDHSYSSEGAVHQVSVAVTDGNGQPVTTKAADLQEGESTYVALPDGEYQYEISEDGYESSEGEIQISKANVTQEIELTAIYRAEFHLDDGVNFALYQLNGEDKTLVEPEKTEEGSCIYALKNGSYAYNAAKEGYAEQYWYDPDHQFTVSDEAVDIRVTMISLLDISKASAKAEIEGYRNTEDYYLDQKNEIKQIITKYEDIIDAEESIEAVVEDTAKAKAELANVRTIEYIDNEMQIKNVAALIDKIGQVTSLDAGVKGAITRARNAYNALRESAKAQMDPAEYGKLTSAEETYEALYQKAIQNATPGAIRDVTVTTTYHSVTLNWTDEEAATGYVIRRASSIGGNYAVIATLGKVTSYQDAGLSTGKTYYYKVTGVGEYDGKTLTGQESEAISANPELGRVKNLKTTSGRHKLKITWSKVTGADHYQVSVSRSKTKIVYVTKSTKKLTLTKRKLTKGKRYYVKVRAVAANGHAGAWSTVKSGKVK